nr:probable nucleolar protein 5-2 [Tanacetum cinerariifolium]
FHASLIGQAAPKIKGKMSRSLASKTALAIRCDALGDNLDNSMGVENRVKLEARLRNLEGRELGHAAGSTKGKPKIEVYNKDQKKGGGAMITPAKSYNPAADSVLGRLEAEVEDEQMVEAVTDGKKDKKKKKKAKAVEDDEVADEEATAKKDKKKK